jgi:hypothetical protein
LHVQSIPPTMSGSRQYVIASGRMLALEQRVGEPYIAIRGHGHCTSALSSRPYTP